MNVYIMFHDVMTKSTDISRSTVQYFGNSRTKSGIELKDTCMIVRIAVFWNVTQYTLVELFHRSVQPASSMVVLLSREDGVSSEISLHLCHAARRHGAENGTYLSQCLVRSISALRLVQVWCIYKRELKVLDINAIVTIENGDIWRVSMF